MPSSYSSQRKFFTKPHRWALLALLMLVGGLLGWRKFIRKPTTPNLDKTAHKRRLQQGRDAWVSAEPKKTLLSTLNVTNPCVEIFNHITPISEQMLALCEQGNILACQLAYRLNSTDSNLRKQVFNTIIDKCSQEKHTACLSPDLQALFLDPGERKIFDALLEKLRPDFYLSLAEKCKGGEGDFAICDQAYSHRPRGGSAEKEAEIWWEKAKNREITKQLDLCLSGQSGAFSCHLAHSLSEPGSKAHDESFRQILKHCAQGQLSICNWASIAISENKKISQTLRDTVYQARVQGIEQAEKQCDHGLGDMQACHGMFFFVVNRGEKRDRVAEYYRLASERNYKEKMRLCDGGKGGLDLCLAAYMSAPETSTDRSSIQIALSIAGFNGCDATHPIPCNLALMGDKAHPEFQRISQLTQNRLLTICLAEQEPAACEMLVNHYYQAYAQCFPEQTLGSSSISSNNLPTSQISPAKTN